MKSKLLALVFLAGSAAFAGPRIFVGVGFGAAPVAVYAPPPAYVPVAPGPGYAWVAGYRYPVGAGWGWHSGYWAARPYAHASWVAPRVYGGRFHGGYWRR
jgi:hypothetical protein